MSDGEALVFIVSGDPLGRRDLTGRTRSLGFTPRLCHSAEEFEELSAPDEHGCVLLHLTEAEFDLELLHALGRAENHWPVICLSAITDVGTVVTAMKLGAWDFLEMTCPDSRLAAAIDEAVRWDAARRKQIAHAETVRRRWKRLDPRHREVLERIVRGHSNREIADELGLSVRSIEVRRAKIMRTTKARSMAELIRQALLVEGYSAPHEASGNIAGVGNTERVDSRLDPLEARPPAGSPADRASVEAEVGGRFRAEAPGDQSPQQHGSREHKARRAR